MGSDEAHLRVRLAAIEDHAHLQSVLDESTGMENATVFGVRTTELLDRYHVYLAFREERPIACVMATQTKPLVLHCLHVVEDFRGRGYAGCVLNLAIRHLEATVPPTTYWATVEPALPSAGRRLRQLGFVELSIPFQGMTLMMRPIGDKGAVAED